VQDATTFIATKGKLAKTMATGIVLNATQGHQFPLNVDAATTMMYMEKQPVMMAIPTTLKVLRM
jgi:hypothetical protein